MTILIIGLGSMGKRRIRCLQALGYTDIAGMDTRQDRQVEAIEKYGIKIVDDPYIIPLSEVFICLPPKFHRQFSKAFKEFPTFIEAGIEPLEYGSPSATMMYHPAIKEIRQRLPEIGRIINITYHSGQYLPDWHPYEKVSDFYAGEVGAKEMVAFELMWFCKVFGLPHLYDIYHTGTTDIDGLKAPDSYAMTLALSPDAVANVMIDVVSRVPTRELIINSTGRQLRYNLNEGISEQIYIDETKAFMEGKLCNTLTFNNKIVSFIS